MHKVSDFNKRLIGWLAIAALFLLAGCGGSADNLAAPASNDSEQRLLPLGAPLPELPRDLPGDAVAPRGASVIGEYAGAEFLQASGGTVDGDALVLQSGPDQIAWALYKVSGLQGQYVNLFGVEAVPGDLGQQYSVGLSNFSNGVWEYFLTSTLPEAEADLTGNDRRLTSYLGNLYYIVVVHDGASVRIDNAYLDASDGSGWLPAMPEKPNATQNLTDSVLLHWPASPGAEHYELERRSGIGGQWELLATTDSPSYEDFEVVSDQEYEYRVRAVNEFGGSSFSGASMGMCSTHGGGHGNECSATGPIEAMDDSTLIVDGKTFLHDGETWWVDADGNLIGRDAFELGEVVYVFGYEPFDGSGGCMLRFVAKTEGGGGGPETFNTFGYLEEITETTLTIEGAVFAHDEDTVWWFNGKVATRDDLVIGGIAAVNGTVLADGTHLCSSVDQWDDGIEEFTRDGQINAIDAEMITVDGEVYLHDGNTLWYDHGGEPTDWTGLNVGEFVWINGAYEGDGPALLTSVSQKYESFQITGVIDEIGSGPLVVDGETYYPHFWTVWVDEHGNEASPDDFSVGDTVQINVEQVDDTAWANNVYMLNDA